MTAVDRSETWPKEDLELALLPTGKTQAIAFFLSFVHFWALPPPSYSTVPRTEAILPDPLRSQEANALMSPRSVGPVDSTLLWPVKELLLRCR